MPSRPEADDQADASLTDAHHDWVSDTFGADPRQYVSAAADDAPELSGAAGMSSVSADGAGYSTTAPEPSSSSAADAGVPGGAPPPAAPDPTPAPAPDNDDDGATAGDDDAGAPAMAMAGGGRGGRGKPPVEKLEDGEGKNRDGTVRRKPGEGGRSRGTDAKREQDGAVDDAVRDFGLDEDEREELHQEIGGRGLDRDGVREIAEEIAKRRKSNQKPQDENDPEKDPAKDPAKDPEKDGEKAKDSDPAPSSDSGVNWARVAEVVAAIGIGIALIPTIIAALADPEPASKLALAGLTLLEIGALAKAFGFKFSPGSSDPDQA